MMQVMLGAFESRRDFSCWKKKKKKKKRKEKKKKGCCTVDLLLANTAHSNILHRIFLQSIKHKY